MQFSAPKTSTSLTFLNRCDVKNMYHVENEQSLIEVLIYHSSEKFWITEVTELNENIEK